MSILPPLKTAVTTAALVLGLSLFALAVGIALASTTAMPARAGEIDVSAELGQSVIPSKGGKIHLRLSLRAAAHEASETRPPINVGLVLDRSGSMRGARIDAAKEAARMALGRLGRTDTVALVAYNHNVDILQPARRLDDHEAFSKAIGKLVADGRTALYAGVEAGGREVARYLDERRINRVILMSDGLANVGPSQPRELARLGRDLGAKGISVTTIGLGLGYNEDLMQQLALASDGNHAFAEKPDDLVDVFNAEFGDALSIAAQDIEIIIEVKAGFKPVRVLGRHADIDGSTVKLRFNQLTALNERYVIVELDAADFAPAEDVPVATVRTDYLDLQRNERRNATARVNVTISDDAKRQAASIDADVQSQITTQVATLRSEEAVALRDKGDLEGARKLLEENASFIGASRARLAKPKAPGVAPASAEAIAELEKLERQSVKAAGNLDADNWSKTRKSMRYEQHKAKMRQSY